MYEREIAHVFIAVEENHLPITYNKDDQSIANTVHGQKRLAELFCFRHSYIAMKASYVNAKIPRGPQNTQTLRCGTLEHQL